MENREPRVKVFVAARLRVGIDWIDVRIENVSSRGLMLKPKVPVKRGTVVELRHGNAIIIGRIVWARDGLAGLRTQDRIDTSAMLTKAGRPSPATPHDPSIERRDNRARRASQTAHRAERSRALGNVAQFLSVGASVAIGCILLANLVGGLLAKASTAIITALG